MTLVILARMNTLHPTLLAMLLSSALHAQEICDNAIDDDGDGAIDLNDPDCGCFGSLSGDVPSLIPNHSFEERVQGPNGLCCPFGFVSPFSPPWMSCTPGWEHGTNGTADYFHTCGYMPEHMVVQPIPDGQGFVGVFPGIGEPGDRYYEYIHRGGMDFPELQVGTPYTLEVWMAPTSSDGQHSGTIGNFYDGAVRMALIADVAGTAVPVGTMGCLGAEPGWTELATVELSPSTIWQRVRFDFTPQEEIHALVLGGSCQQSDATFMTTVTTISGEDTITSEYSAFVLIDDWVLNTTDQFEQGITSTGAWCTNDLVLEAVWADGAAYGQWYHNGIALTWEVAATLDLSGTAHDGGLYTFTQQGPDGCIRQDINLPMRPAFTMAPDTGYVPMEVTFITNNGQDGLWDLGDGTTIAGDTIVHTYTEAGSYTVTLDQEVLGCTMTTTVADAVLVWPLVELQIIATPQPTDINATEITLSGEGPAGIVSWQWDLGTVEPLTAEGQQVVVDFPAEPGTYPVMLVVSGDLRELESDTAYYDVVILSGSSIHDGVDAPVQLMPNPVQDVLHVRAPFSPERWRMLNALGQVVRQGRGNGASLVLDTRTLRTGTYVLVLESDTHIGKVRFVKD